MLGTNDFKTLGSLSECAKESFGDMDSVVESLLKEKGTEAISVPWSSLAKIIIMLK